MKVCNKYLKNWLGGLNKTKSAKKGGFIGVKAGGGPGGGPGGGSKFCQKLRYVTVERLNVPCNIRYMITESS